MKTLNACALLALTLLTPVFGAGENWTSDFEAAKKKAAAEKKDLLIDFTGSDWCGWCIKLREEVFQHDAFKKGVADKFILVELDYPRDKSKMSKETIAQNERLKEEYFIQGYPTIYLTDAEGRPYAKAGYKAGGAEAYVKHLDGLRKKREARDEAMEAVKNAKGDEERIQALETLLKRVPREGLLGFYRPELNDLKKLDPKSEYVSEVEKAEAAEKQRKGFMTLFQKHDFDGVIKQAESMLAERKPTGEARQELLAYKLNALMEQQNFEEALKVTDEIHKADPNSRYGKGIPQFRGRLEQMAADAKKKAGTAEEATKEPGESPKAKGNKQGGRKEDTKKEARKPAANVEAPKKPMAKQEAKPAPKKSNVVQVPVTKGLHDLNDKQLKEKLDKTRKQFTENAKKHESSHSDWVKAKKDAQAIEDEIAKQKKALAELDKKAGASSRKIKEQEDAHAAAEKAEKELKSALEAQEKELAKRAEIRKLEEQAAKLKAQAEALEKRAAELK